MSAQAAELGLSAEGAELGLSAQAAELGLSAQAAELGLSAEGAAYDSQGQALSGAKCVAPGLLRLLNRALKERNIFRTYFALSELHQHS